jgi:hypothetical protein
MANTTRHIVTGALAAFALSGCASTAGHPVTVVAPQGTTTYEAGKLAEGDVVRCKGSGLSLEAPSSGNGVSSSLGIGLRTASDGSVTAVCHPANEG